MPNFCENDLTAEGPKDVVLDFLKFAAGESPFDFNRFIPYPEKYIRLDNAAEAWDKDHAGRPDYDCRKRPKDGFNSGGYKWCVTNWGTKWPAARAKVETPVVGYDGETLQVVFHFDTAWSPPLPVIKNAAERFPALTFELRYFERGAGFNGLFRCEQGEVVTDASGDYFGTRGG